MRKYLVDVPARGDTVIFFDASHGSLRVNSQGSKMTVLLNGTLVHANSTLVPADAYKGGFDISDSRDDAHLPGGTGQGRASDCDSGLVPQRGRRCGLEKYRARSLAFDPRDLNQGPEVAANGQPRPSPTERTDNPALVFSAAQQDQEADEADPTPAQPESHGAFTAALIEALQALPADTPASLVYQRVKAVLEANSFTHQEPDLDATAARRQQPLFGGGAAGDRKSVRAAALKMAPDGSVWLDIGRVSGVGVGSEFVSTQKNAHGEITRLRLDNLQGIARSTATVVSPAGAKVNSGEVFELKKWIPAESAPCSSGHGRQPLSPANSMQPLRRSNKRE